MPVHMPRNRPLREPMSSRLDIQAPRDIRDPAHHPPPPHRRSEDRANHHSQIMESSFMENSYNNPDAYERSKKLIYFPQLISRNFSLSVVVVFFLCPRTRIYTIIALRLKIC